MFVPKRWLFLLTSTSTLLFVSYQVYLFTWSGPRPVQVTPDVSHPGVGDTTFKWNYRPQHYPLKTLTPLPTAKPRKLPKVQHQFGEESAADHAIRTNRRNLIKQEFLHCWRSYKEKAWMHDEVAPISGQAKDYFGGWGATLVDALDTLWIMDLKDEFREAAHAAKSIDFSKSTDNTINIFETTIRYLGGFLGAYDLSHDVSMLEKAKEVGDMLLVAFDTPNHFPITRWQWQSAVDFDHRQEAPSSMLVSELGSLSLEFTRLSQLTKDNRWFDAVDRIMNLFDVQQDKTKLPGLWPVVINPKAEDLTFDTGFTFGGMSDSLYEYFPKQFALLGGVSPVYQKMYQKSMDAAMNAIFFRPMTPTGEDILISGDARASNDGKSFVTEAKGQHLGCFAGGMLGLGGKLFSNEDHVLMGKKLTEGCIWAYKAMSRGVMPEVAHFVACESKTECPWDEQKWKAAVLERQGSRATTETADTIIAMKDLASGYVSIDDKRYILRPEAIESVFILYRITGDQKYRDAAWDMFTAIEEVSRTDLAYAAISDITIPPSKGNAPKDDRMESFWFAETLKYFYLIFSEPELISLDEYVLNTEAHPLRRPV